MHDTFKQIYAHYSSFKRGTDEDLDARFDDLWKVFEAFLDDAQPFQTEAKDTFSKRLTRLERDLNDQLLLPWMTRVLLSLPESRQLAELIPRISRDSSNDTSHHESFASDFARHERNQKTKQALVRLLNLLYTIRCNSVHGSKILADEWGSVKARNQLVFSLALPLLRALDEMIITSRVSFGVFSYGTLPTLVEKEGLGYSVSVVPDKKIKGLLFDVGAFPAWRYESWGWVHGCVLRAPLRMRDKFVKVCDSLEGRSFERRLVVVHDSEGADEHLAWAYHYNEPTHSLQRVEDGVWNGDS